MGLIESFEITCIPAADVATGDHIIKKGSPVFNSANLCGKFE